MGAPAIELWNWDLDGVGARATDVGILSDAERERAARLRIASVRERWVAAHVLTRRALADYVGASPASLAFTSGGSGKPALVGYGGVEFSLSHSGGRVLLAATRSGPVGVDIEMVHPISNLTRLARRWFTAAAADRIAVLPREEQLAAFFRHWVVTEAAVKAAGSGLSGIASIAVDLSGETPAVTLRKGAQARAITVIRLWEPAPGFVASLALLHRR
jgi:4'-phosphopantetheinyl transferase